MSLSPNPILLDPPPPERPLGDVVRDARLFLNLTQMDLASQVGMTQGRLSRIECNRQWRLLLDTYIQLADALRVPAELLIGHAVRYERQFQADRTAGAEG